MSPPEKKDLRKSLLAMRKIVDPSQKREWDRQLVHHLALLIRDLGFNRVCLYVPFRHEPDLLGLALLDLGVSWALPVIAEEALSDMTFVVYEPGMAMNPNRFGIPEPHVKVPISWGSVDAQTLVVVPALAVDYGGVRLGYGGGYYDVFMSRFDPQSRPFLVAALPRDWVLPTLPREDHDLLVDRIITEEGVLVPMRT